MPHLPEDLLNYAYRHAHHKQVNGRRVMSQNNYKVALSHEVLASLSWRAKKVPQKELSTSLGEWITEATELEEEGTGVSIH